MTCYECEEEIEPGTQAVMAAVLSLRVVICTGCVESHCRHGLRIEADRRAAEKRVPPIMELAQQVRT